MGEETKSANATGSKGLISALQLVRERPMTVTLSGIVMRDQNFPRRRLVVIESSKIISVNEDDIIGEGKLDSGLNVLEVSASSQVWLTSPVALTEGISKLANPLEMELLSPPEPPAPKKGDPVKASFEDIETLESIHGLVNSIAGAASKYSGSCQGGDDYPNDCAHFLSDAFIRAGYTELNSPNVCINARCGASAKRPIRARDMWCWFQKMAKRSERTLPSNDGFWAVFQLKEDEYWGGHVVIIDTNSGNYYGTGNYPNWDQYAYQW